MIDIFLLHVFCRYIRSVDGGRAFNTVYTIMNEHGQILAQWLANSQSPGELSDQIKALTARYADGKGVEALWLDHQDLGGPFIEHFPASLKHVLVDIFHLEQRVVRCVPKEWSLKGQLMARLSQAFFKVHEEDVILYQLHAEENKGHTMEYLVIRLS